MAKLTTWPFQPHHITNDGASIPGKERLNGEGIVSNKFMHGLQTAICAAIENPTTIIEFSPDETLPPQEACVRTDSKLLFYEMRPTCARFRENTSAQCCYRSDDIHALLFRGLKRSSLIEKATQRAAEDALVHRYRQDPDVTFEFVTRANRPFLQYDCPMLGYRELILPVFLEDRVLAVFFVGQLCLRKKLNFIAQKQREFFASAPMDSLSIACSEHSPKPPCELSAEIRDEHNRWVADPQNVLDDAAYASLIGNVCIELDDFEAALEDQLKLERHEYIRKRVDDTIKGFRENFPMHLARTDDGLHDLWAFIGQHIAKLADAFTIDYVVVYGMNTLGVQDSLRLPVVAFTGNPPAAVAQKRESVYYDLELVPEKCRLGYHTTPDVPELFNGLAGLKDVLRPDRVRVRLVGATSAENRTLAMLLGYGPGNGPEREENHSEEYLDSALQVFYSLVVASLSWLAAASAQSKSDTMLKIFGHEAGQLTAGLEGLRETYLSKPETFVNLPTQKLEDLARDINAYVRLLNLLSNNVKAILTDPKPEPTSFRAYRELLFKWRDIYRQEARRKSLQFVIVPIDSEDPLRPPVYADLNLMEQLVYNLVNNAVKYSYRGTKIGLDCKKQEPGARLPHILTVTNYGIEVEGGDRIYELNQRGARIERVDKTGQGIGLFVARKMADAHGGRIWHTFDKISDYNVPLFEHYLKIGEASNIKLPSQDAVAAELDRLKREGKYDMIVARTSDSHLLYSNPTRLEVMKAITLATWKVTFWVEIPPREGKA